MKISFSMPLLAITLSACSMGAGHVPPAMVVLAPVARPINKISDKIYQHRLKKVTQYVTLHYDALKVDIKNGRGKTLEGLVQQLPRSNRKMPTLRQELQAQYQALFNNPQNVAMRISLIATQAKAPQQQQYLLPYPQRIALRQAIGHDFNAFRLAVKNKDQQYLASLAGILALNPEQQSRFYIRLFNQYDSIFMESVAQKILWIR